MQCLIAIDSILLEKRYIEVEKFIKKHNLKKMKFFVRIVLTLARNASGEYKLLLAFFVLSPKPFVVFLFFPSRFLAFERVLELCPVHTLFGHPVQGIITIHTWNNSKGFQNSFLC